MSVAFKDLQVGHTYVFPYVAHTARFTLGAKPGTKVEDLLVKKHDRFMALVGTDITIAGVLPMNRFITTSKETLRENYFVPGAKFRDKAIASAPEPPKVYADPWDEFNLPGPTDEEEAEGVQLEDYESAARIPKYQLSDFMSPEDIAVQVEFRKKLTPEDIKYIFDYQNNGYTITNPIMTGIFQTGRSDIPNSTTIEEVRGRVGWGWGKPTQTPVPGYIPQYMAGFGTTIGKAPRLIHELNVFRGVTSETLEMKELDGNSVLSTSYNKYTALGFSGGPRQCCLLKVNVKPGVKVISMDVFHDYNDWNSSEHELLIIPPYKVQVTEIAKGLKQVVITPVTWQRKSGTRRRRSYRKKTRSRR